MSSCARSSSIAAHRNVAGVKLFPLPTHQNCPPLRLGERLFAPPLLLAPMAGYTNAATRRLARRHGASLTFTEMVNAAGLARGAAKIWQLLASLEGDEPVAAHLYGNDPATFAEAARRVAATGRFVALDINAGCPAPKIARCGAGVLLMDNPALLGRIVAAMRAVTDLPVTVKTRLGRHPGEVAIFDVLAAVEAAGAAALTVHARYASQGHVGEVDLKLLAEVKRRSRIPVIGNGGLTDGAAVRRMLAATAVDAVMIGHAAIGNPWIFQAAAAAMMPAAAAPPRVPLAELRQVLFEHLDSERLLLQSMAADYPFSGCRLPPERAAIVSFRLHLFRYLRGLQGASWARGQLHQIQTLDDVHRVVDGCLQREAAYRKSVGKVTPVTANIDLLKQEVC